MTRAEQLERHGRAYGELKLAVVFTDGIEGDAAKRVRQTSWQLTRPLATPAEGAAHVKTRGEKRNVAVVLGASGLIGVDIDGEAGLSTLKRFGVELPQSVTVKTGKGWHGWFRKPEGWSGPVKIELAEVVTASSEGYLIAPPSLHASGEAYRFADRRAPWECELAELPVATLAQLCAAANGHRNGNTQTSAPGEPIPEGSRNTSLTSLAGTMRNRGMGESTIEAALQEENRRRCKPPLGEDEVRAIARSVSRYAPAPQAAEAHGGAVTGHGSGNGRRVRAVPASAVRRRAVEWLVEGRVPLGSVTLLAGEEGLGKSQWTCLVAAKLSLGELGVPAVSLLATAEDSRETTIRPRLQALGANLDLVRFIDITTEAGEDGIAIPDDLAELERLIAETSAKLVVVDPLMAHLPSGIDSFKDQSVRRALAPLYRIADSYGCAVVCVVHLNKGNHANVRGRIGGSAAFPAAARSVLLFARDPDDEDPEKGVRRALAHTKCNLAPLAPTLVYELETVELPASEDEPAMVSSRLRYLSESEHSGRDLLAAATSDSDHRSALEEAKDFLRAELYDGPVLQEQIARDAKGHGISDATLRRARVALDVKPKKMSFKEGWQWRLPLFEGSAEDAQGVEHLRQSGPVEHLRANPHEQRDCGASEAAPKPEDAHAQKMSTFGGSEGIDAPDGIPADAPEWERAWHARRRS